MNEADTATDLDDAGFDDGFADDAPTETPAQGQQATTTDDNEGTGGEGTGTEGQQPTAAAPEYVQLTKDEAEQLRAAAARLTELQATSEKSFGTAFGKLGDMERRIKAMSEGAPIAEIDQDEIDALRADGFEPMARVLEKLRDLRAINVGGGVDQSKVDELVQQKLAPALQRVELRLLAREHPDWKAIDGDPAFAEWTRSKGDEFVRTLAQASEQYDSETVSQAMTEFKAHRKAQADAKKRQEEGDAQRRSRINAAVTPRGTGAAPAGASPEDEFDAGFQG